MDYFTKKKLDIMFKTSNWLTHIYDCKASPTKCILLIYYNICRYLTYHEEMWDIY